MENVNFASFIPIRKKYPLKLFLFINDKWTVTESEENIPIKIILFTPRRSSWSVNLVWNYLDVEEEDFLSSEINLEFKYRYY